MWLSHRNEHIPPNYVVERFSYSSKAARGEDLQVEHPVWCGYAPAFHFYPTLPGMLGATLIRDQVVQMGQPAQKRLVAPFGPNPTLMSSAAKSPCVAVTSIVPNRVPDCMRP